jgi:hypothetical protein
MPSLYFLEKISSIQTSDSCLTITNCKTCWSEHSALLCWSLMDSLFERGHPCCSDDLLNDAGVTYKVLESFSCRSEQFVSLASARL